MLGGRRDGTKQDEELMKSLLSGRAQGQMRLTQAGNGMMPGGAQQRVGCEKGSGDGDSSDRSIGGHEHE